jgi:hypothetical protein
MRVTQSFDPAQDREPAERPFDASTMFSIDPERCRRVGFAQDRESFDFAQDRESFDFAQDRELVERLVERLVEWQVGVFRQPYYLTI